VSGTVEREVGAHFCPQRQTAKEGHALQPVRITTLRLAISWPEEKPEDQAQQWQQHNDKYPKQFLLVRSGALENIYDRPDISGEYEQAQNSAVSEIHHCCSFPVSQKRPSLMPHTVRPNG